MKHHFQMLKHVTMDLVAKQHLLQNNEDVLILAEIFKPVQHPAVICHTTLTSPQQKIKILFFQQGSFAIMYILITNGRHSLHVPMWGECSSSSSKGAYLTALIFNPSNLLKDTFRNMHMISTC